MTLRGALGETLAGIATRTAALLVQSDTRAAGVTTQHDPRRGTEAIAHFKGAVLVATSGNMRKAGVDRRCG
jgi:hypothetical protein